MGQSDDLEAKFLQLHPELKDKIGELKIIIAKSIRIHVKDNSSDFNDHMTKMGLDQNGRNRFMRNVLGYGVASMTINNGNSIPICLYCDEPNKKATLCSGCDIVYYCNRSCQKSDWKNHKILCDNGSQYKKLLKLRAAIRNGDISCEEEEMAIVNEIVINRMNSQVGLNKLPPDLQETEIIMELILDMKELEGVITKSMKKSLLKKRKSVLYKKCVQCSGRKNLLRCAKCKNVYYCSRTCQKANWKEHKLICHIGLGGFF